jgi:hypothetical protein
MNQIVFLSGNMMPDSLQPMIKSDLDSGAIVSYDKEGSEIMIVEPYSFRP